MRRTKTGDVFEIKLNDFNRYIQYLGKDKNCLDGDVIRCFRYKGSLAESGLSDMLLTSGVLFVAHTYIGVGIKLGVWDYIGNVPLEGDFVMPIFRATYDAALQAKVSEKWRIWRPNEEIRFVGRLTDDLRLLPYGSVFQPHYIKKWAATGKAGFVIPD